MLFEVRAGGRSPGKRALGLRVVMADGGAVGLRASSVRNLLRLIEGLPLSYVPAIVSILLTRNNQRLGDLAAGTVVAREPARAGPSFRAAAERRADLGGWDVSAVTPEELAAVRSFLDRRSDFAPAARRELARTLAERLRGARRRGAAGIALRALPGGPRAREGLARLTGRLAGHGRPVWNAHAGATRAIDAT